MASTASPALVSVANANNAAPGHACFCAAEHALPECGDDACKERHVGHSGAVQLHSAPTLGVIVNGPSLAESALP